MKTIDIKHRHTSECLFTTAVEDDDPNPLRTAVRKAISADANLAGANLADANLAGANLADAYLAGAYLAGAYLAGAKNVPIGVEKTDPPEPYVRATTPEQLAERRAERMRRYRERHPEVPVVEQLDRKILDAVTSGGGSLEMAHWHTCATTHCRGGWAIHFAGPAGWALEDQHGAQRAASMIYSASTGRVPHFLASNERALEDIKRCAEDQAESSP